MDKLSERLEAEAATWPIDAISGGPHKLRALLTEAAKLARRVEEAPTGKVGIAITRSKRGCEVMLDVPLAGGIAGRRVRLVREE